LNPHLGRLGAGGGEVDEVAVAVGGGRAPVRLPAHELERREKEDEASGRKVGPGVSGFLWIRRGVETVRPVEEGVGQRLQRLDGLLGLEEVVEQAVEF
jgi:hypothetical protein